ncbi:MAG: acetyl-CoA carboxylase biotin carboxyl carrier protein subunit [Anaerolineae bacterium]|nr:biotin/lipoyl-binding protein [Anaerolineales bacterium]MCQ3972938.1 acetyl-CoA carboxylase biotin carboxyl carrier protein subunit [Anaerolineae bacterium]
MKKLRVTVDGISYEVEVEFLEDSDGGGAAGHSLPAASVPQVAQPAPAPAASPAAPAPPAAGAANEVVSPIAGVARKINVAVGDVVKQNQPVVVVEAMKMNTNINARAAGKVKEIKIKVGEPVQKGQVLLILE